MRWLLSLMGSQRSIRVLFYPSPRAFSCSTSYVRCPSSLSNPAKEAKYAAPGVRMGALQRLQQIHIATHDSIGTGEDGPTHQPIALAALYRAMPNILYIRPCDSEETAGAFIAALKATSSPTIISLSRQTLQQYPDSSSREGVLRGGYCFIDEEDAEVTLVGVGSEMCFAVGARKVLKEKHNIKSRIVSMPCQRLFENQPLEYKRDVLRYRTTTRVVIEAYAANGWERFVYMLNPNTNTLINFYLRYADAGYSMHTFGHSLPGKSAYEYFGINEEVRNPKLFTFYPKTDSRIGHCQENFAPNRYCTRRRVR